MSFVQNLYTSYFVQFKMPDGSWKDVMYGDGDILVICGDLMLRWTADGIKAPVSMHYTKLNVFGAFSIVCENPVSPRWTVVNPVLPPYILFHHYKTGCMVRI